MIDETLARFSRLFGTGLHDPVRQHACLLLAFGAIHVAALMTDPRIAWILLWLGYVGVLGVGRAWVANEKLRTAIARKLSDVDPDELPDLRWSALLSALQLIVIVPLLLRLSHALFDLYDVPDRTGFADWLLLGVDLLFRSLLDWSEIYGVQMSSIGLDAMGGRHLVMLFLLTIDFILIQGLLRIFEIRRTLDEGVAAAGRDPEMAYRLGRRASMRLLALLDDGELNSAERIRVMEALAVLREPRASRAFIDRLDEAELHTTAVAGLVAIGGLPPLRHALAEGLPNQRRGAVTALGRLGDPDTLPDLMAVFASAEVESRERIVRAVARIDTGARPHLMHALSDAASSVRLAALQALAGDHSEGLMRRLVEMAADPDPEIRLAAVDALQRFSDGRVVAPLAAALEDGDPRVARQARRSLDHLQSVVDRGGTG